MAVATGVVGAWLGTRLGMARTVPSGFDALMSAAIAGVFSGRIAHMIGVGTNPITHPLDVLLIRGGVDPVVASMVAIGFLAWNARRTLPGMLDALGPAAALGMTGWHTGCLWRSACLGTRADLPWAWALPGSDLARHPVELYTAGLILMGALIGIRLQRPWAATGIAIGSVAAARLITSPIRLTIESTPVWYLVVGLVLGLILLVGGPHIPGRSDVTDLIE